MSFFNKVLILVFLIGIKYGINCAQSPININLFTKDKDGYKMNIRYPAKPFFYVNSTLYEPISSRKFERECDNYDFNFRKNDGTCGGNVVSMDAKGLGKLYMTFYNYTLFYNLKKIYLKVFAEHAFEGTLADLELQLIHEIDPTSTYKLYALESIINQQYQEEINGYANEYLEKYIIDNELDATTMSDVQKSQILADGKAQAPSIISPHFTKLTKENYQYVGLSIRFTSVRNKKSKDELIDEIAEKKVNGDYDFKLIEFADLNQYFRKGNSYYHYEGTGTTSKTESSTIQWFLLNEVQDMNVKEFDNIHKAILQQTGAKFGNSKAYTSETPMIFYTKKD